jgi:hypothetical protein
MGGWVGCKGAAASYVKRQFLARLEPGSIHPVPAIMSNRARASEFPNDNPQLHRGAVWVMQEPCAPWEPERAATPAPPVVECAAIALETAPLPLPETAIATESEATTETEAETETLVAASATAGAFDAFDDEVDGIEVVEELEPLELDLAPSDGDPFATFIATLVEVAVEAGCDRAAAILPALLEGGRVMPGVLPGSVTDALLESGMLARTDAGLVGGEPLRQTAAAWRAILRGDSEDFSSCGSRMLDEWAADLVACLVAAPAKTERLRRELRTRGVAAFGLVAA